MPRSSHRHAARIVAIGLAGVHSVTAQAPAYITALVVPPPTVGTCVPARVESGRDAAAGERRGRRLVMTTRAPGGRREMTVHTDAGGRLREYGESVHRMTGPTTSVGEHVTAAVRPDGQLRGVLVRTTIAMEAPVVGRVDTAELRAMRERALTTQAREPLGVREQAQVRAAAAWLLRRCPA